ncbi:hypothetical protein [Corynebacterium mastitidis]|uniref:hypothetical protein n=1 Tax=Corynebacterium mastitidis TaxID=161890 RepID=UPI00254B7F42|nr:hypothetical protein [Corynebacterium mastitidis]MDK8451430.1 hypothetical protein [Corynebacterium mastitidis]
MNLEIGEEASIYTGISHGVFGIPNSPEDRAIGALNNISGLKITDEANGDKEQVKNLCRERVDDGTLKINASE